MTYALVGTWLYFRTVLSLDERRNPPPHRGKLLDAVEVAHEILRDKVGADWVRKNVPGKGNATPEEYRAALKEKHGYDVGEDEAAAIWVGMYAQAHLVETAA